MSKEKKKDNTNIVVYICLFFFAILVYVYEPLQDYLLNELLEAKENLLNIANNIRSLFSG